MSEVLRQIFEFIWSFIPRVETLTPWQGGLRITLGRHVRDIGPGWYLVWPLIQEVRYIDTNTDTADLRVQSVWTKDGKDLAISGGVRYRINNVRSAFVNVQEVEVAIANTALGTIAEYVNARTADDCRDITDLKGEIVKGLRTEASGWGVKIERVFITDIGTTMNLRLLHHGDHNGC